MVDENINIASFRGQAAGNRHMGAPFMSDVLEALADILDDQTKTGRRIMAWSVDPLVDVLPLRLAGGLHALARSGRDPALSAFYGAKGGDIAGVLRRSLIDHDEWLERWLDSPPQTNEVMRSAGLMAGLMHLVSKIDQPIELLELGSSAGLNLNLDRFDYDLGGVRAGDPGSGVKLKPDWSGSLPRGSTPSIISRAGVDLRPVDLSQDEAVERLIAYVWVDQTERLQRIQAAIDLARAFPPSVVAGDAPAWLDAQLALPQAAGVTRVVMHSVFWQYLPPETQVSITDAIMAAGALAAADRPLAWLTFEPRASLYAMGVTLRVWPTGEELHLANCHPHGTTIEWLG
jgi:hypothetical protein